MGPFNKTPFQEGKLQKKWPGKRRVVVSLDIGATHTAVAVAILAPGSLPVIINISRWPGQEDRIYEQKVPTVVLYDRRGQAVACGAEALSREHQDAAEAQGWTLAKNFKLLLHPDAVKNNLTLDDLPLNVRLKDVYTDFMIYVVNHTRAHLRADMGRDVWTSDVEVILAHPNLWGEREQEFLREIAVSAGLIPNTEIAKNKQLFFVEEAEASARYCISAATNPFASQLKKGSKFIVCDAGGSTVDITTYEIKSISSDRLKLEELAAPSCAAAGGLYVDNELRKYLEDAFASPAYHPETIRDYIQDGVKDFEQHGKREFNPNKREILVHVAGRDVNDDALNIQHGDMVIPGGYVQTLFDPSVNRMVECLAAQLETQGVEHIILTGGLGESPYVKHHLQDIFGTRCGIVVANSSNSKAVAVGALMLAIGEGNVTVDRQQRSHATWLTNFETLAKILGGVAAFVGAILPLVLQAGN